MKSINKLLISAVSAISLAMPLVAASCGVTKPSEQGSGSKHRHNKPSEQGSRSKLSDTKSHQNKVQETNNQNRVQDLNHQR
nr:variable surface lipoprotein [Mycoplasmopsis bovis]